MRSHEIHHSRVRVVYGLLVEIEDNKAVVLRCNRSPPRIYTTPAPSHTVHPVVLWGVTPCRKGNGTEGGNTTQTLTRQRTPRPAFLPAALRNSTPSAPVQPTPSLTPVVGEQKAKQERQLD